MCGIVGFWQPPGEDGTSLLVRVGRMSATLRHRGPDDDGAWADPAVGLALGFRRLAILDLSPTGHQPMTSAEGRYTVVFNGEIYNYRDLKSDLLAAGHGFRGTSDTEVMLAGFSRWGVRGTLERLSGMFGLAVWDASARTLTLARDRMGEKPVYYGRCGGTWLFGSELKALRLHPHFEPRLDCSALSQFVQFAYVPAPRSIYEGIGKLPPGHFVSISGSGAGTPTPYWDVDAVVREGERHPLPLDESSAIDDLDRLLRDAVAQRMVADVPLGAFLSGGIDSSTIVALMQAQSSRPVKTFTAGFGTAGYNEADAAKAVASHLGTDHTEMYVTPAQALDVIPKLPAMYDEPFGDSSQIPTHLISVLARSGVTVALSGDGGDELFAGYNRYVWGPGIWRVARRVPLPARRAAGAAAERMPVSAVDRLYGAFLWVLPPPWRVAMPADKLHKLATVMSSASREELYGRLISAWPQPERVTAAATRVVDAGSASRYVPSEYGPWMMYRDLIAYLPDDILVKVDRASMSVNLEVRTPFLEHRIVEWAWRLPQALRVRNGGSKWLLRQLLRRYVPDHLTDRPKMGFGIPVNDWLRGPLRDWAEDLLSARSLADGLLVPDPIRRVWRDHLTGHRNEQARLWPILMYQAWRREWMS